MKIRYHTTALDKSGDHRFEAEACTATAIADAIARDVELRFGGYGPGMFFQGDDLVHSSFIPDEVLESDDEQAAAVNGPEVIAALVRMEVTAGGHTLTVFQGQTGAERLYSSKTLAGRARRVLEASDIDIETASLEDIRWALTVRLPGTYCVETAAELDPEGRCEAIAEAVSAAVFSRRKSTARPLRKPFRRPSSAGASQRLGHDKDDQLP